MQSIHDVVMAMDIQSAANAQAAQAVEEKAYPDEHIWPAELSALLNNPHAVKLVIEGPQALCRNCGGSGMMMVYVWTRGPFPTPTGKVKWLEGPGIVTGWYQGETHAAPCPQCQAESWREYLRANCGLTGKDLEVSVAGFKAGGPYMAKEPAAKAARALLAMNSRPRGFVTFWGDPGRGKSHLLKGLVNGFRGVGAYARYINAADLIQDIREKFGDANGGIAVEAVIRYYRNVMVLAIDELDKVQLTDWTRQTLHRLLDSRYEDAGLLTILAMNTDPERLPDDLEYLTSRIRGGGSIEVCGADMRQIFGARRTQQLTEYQNDRD